MRYPEANKLVSQKIKGIRNQLKNLEDGLELLESYGNRRKNIISESFMMCSSGESWSPYEQTFSYIWKTATENKDISKITVCKKKKYIENNSEIFPFEDSADEDDSNIIDIDTELLDKKKLK